MAVCNICPRNCNVDRNIKTGFCSMPDTVKISRAALHMWEEPCISGENGSGTVFFSGCNMKCVFCQNKDISTGGFGKEITIERLSDIFLELQEKGALNINLVTPTHYTLQIIEALKIYRPNIPIVWNTSGYEKKETIAQLKDYVDIYLTDLKYFSSELSGKLSLAKNYFEECSASILEMRKNQPEDVFENDLMKKGIIIRHLVLPNNTADSEKVIDWINENLGNETFVSLMSQYVPMAKAKETPEINRKIKPLEYKILTNKLEKLGFKNVFLQGFSSASTEFTPNFSENKTNFRY